MRWGVQLYSLRNHGTLAEVLALVKRHRFSWVEPFAWPGMTVEQILQQVEGAGLQCLSFHLGLEKAGDDAVLSCCQQRGIKRLVVPYAMYQTEWQWREFARQLEDLALRLAGKGIKLLYHNHTHELQLRFAGKSVLELLLTGAPAVGCQLDLGWTFNAGVEPAELLREWRERVLSVHLKDVGREGRQPDEMGRGLVDLEGLVSLAAHLGVRDVIVEHDDPQDAELMLRSAAALRQRCEVKV